MNPTGIAVIHTHSSGHIPTVCALSILDRLAVLAFRAGCQRIQIVHPTLSSNPPQLPRAQAWNIPVEWSVQPPPPPTTGFQLSLSSEWLVDLNDLKELIAHSIQTRQPLSLACSSPDSAVSPARCIPAPAQSTLSSSTASTSSSHHLARGICLPLRNPAEIKTGERALWNSISSSSDGLVDTWFNRPLGRQLLSKWLIHTPFTPNQISIASILIGVCGAYHLGQGTQNHAVLGAILFQVSAMVDCVDGDVARMIFKETALGKWLDLAGDQVVHIGVFAGITLGLWRMEVAAPVVELGVSTMVGALLSFLVVLRSMLRPQQNDSGLQKLIDGATSRDFSVLVLILACVGHLEWFLWLSAIGSHVFWMLALGLQLRSGSTSKTQLSRGNSQ